jgi:hypothetical protein
VASAPSDAVRQHRPSGVPYSPHCCACRLPAAQPILLRAPSRKRSAGLLRRNRSSGASAIRRERDWSAQAYRSHEATSNDAAERITCVRSWKPTTTAHPSSAGAASPVQSAPSRTMRPGCRAVHAAAVRRCCGPNSANGGAAKAQRTGAAARCACAHGLMGCGLDRRRRHNGMALMDRVALARRSAVRRCFGAERRFGAAAPRVPRGAQRLLLVGYA